MDERRNIIREYEKKTIADTAERNRLLADLGKTLLQRIADDEPFPKETGNTPGAVLADYRLLQKEAAETAENIKSLEEDLLLLKDLDQKISSGAEEQAGLEKELAEDYVQFGKLLLELPGLEGTAGSFRQQEEILLAKIDEQEKKLEGLEEQAGGILAWFGRNAQMALSRTLLLKNQSALQRLYRGAGEHLAPTVPEDDLKGEAAEYSEKITAGKSALSSLNEDLTALRAERLKITERTGAKGSPARHMQVLVKHMDHINDEFSAVYHRLGLLAAENSGGDTLSSFVKKEDRELLEKAKLLRRQIAEKELEIEKIEAAINIDREKCEIEKINKSIRGQQRKISDAEEAITALEKQLAESEQHIEELKAFINNNPEKQEDYGRENKEGR